MRRKHGRLPLLTVVACVGIQSIAVGGEVKVGLIDYTMIDNGKGEARALFRHETLSLPTNAVLSRAVLEFPYSAVASAKTQELIVYPVTTTWTTSGADWSTGWSAAGGDVEENLGSRAAVDFSTPGTATIDVTGMMKDVLEDGVFADGFLLSVPSFAGEGMALDRAAGLDVTGGTLRISYRQVGHGPNAQGTTRRTR
ncbi:MAG: DNRLRE domain-containing protein [Candidatus Eiseniibacteriota bacterium]